MSTFGRNLIFDKQCICGQYLMTQKSIKGQKSNFAGLILTKGEINSKLNNAVIDLKQNTSENVTEV